MLYKLTYGKAYSSFIYGARNIFIGYRYFVYYKKEGWFKFWKTDGSYKSENEARARIGELILEHEEKEKNNQEAKKFKSKIFNSKDFNINLIK